MTGGSSWKQLRWQLLRGLPANCLRYVSTMASSITEPVVHGEACGRQLTLRWAAMPHVTCPLHCHAIRSGDHVRADLACTSDKLLLQSQERSQMVGDCLMGLIANIASIITSPGDIPEAKQMQAISPEVRGC